MRAILDRRIGPLNPQDGFVDQIVGRKQASCFIAKPRGSDLLQFRQHSGCKLVARRNITLAPIQDEPARLRSLPPTARTPISNRRLVALDKL